MQSRVEGVDLVNKEIAVTVTAMGCIGIAESAR